MSFICIHLYSILSHFCPQDGTPNFDQVNRDAICSEKQDSVEFFLTPLPTTPDLGTPCIQNYGQFCIEHFWSSQKITIFGQRFNLIGGPSIVVILIVT